MGADFSTSLMLSLVHGPLSPVPRRTEEAEAYDDLGAPLSVLRDEQELATKLFGWPDEKLSPSNCCVAKFGHEPHMQLNAGDAAVDFSLGTFRLRDALASGLPVMVTGGARSCPHCVAFAADMEAFAREYAGKCVFVCVAVMQPHPAAPEICFETGEVWAMPGSLSAGVGQPATVEARAAEVEFLAAKLPSWTCVADDLAPDRVNPFWSTYGPAPRAGYLIDVSGRIAHSQLWWEPERSRRALDALLAARAAK